MVLKEKDYNNLSEKLIEESSKLQKIASDPNNSCFVLASAGSGKTKILTDRVLRILLSGVKASKILCLTFTKVAALEMKERIFNELSSWSVVTNADLKQKLFKLTGTKYNNQNLCDARVIFTKILDDDQSLKIETIHSFCTNLIKKFPIEAKIQPNFTIIDDLLSQKLLSESKKELLKRAVIDKNLGQKISKIARNSGDLGLFTIISDLIYKRDIFIHLKNSFGNINELQKKLFEIIGADSAKNEEILFQDFFNFTDNDENLLELCKYLAHSQSKSDLAKEELIKKYIMNKNLDNFEEYSDIFLTKEQKPKKNIVTKKMLKEFPHYEMILNLEQNRILDFIENLNSFTIADQTNNIIFIANEILEIYENIKAKDGYLDYNDLIIKANNLLQDNNNSDWIRYKLDNLYDHILIDESQDTNHLQWYIISMISEDFFSGNTEEDNPTIFAVGDEKQSIYGFQGAEPNIFSDIFLHYQNQFKNINQKLEKITLNNSFRSTNAILEVVDLIFANSSYSHKISKLSKVHHRAIRSDSGKVEIWPIITNEKNEKKPIWQLDFSKKEISSKEILAIKIAKEIKSWMINKKTIIDKNGQKRLLKYGDIMILIKNRTNNLGNLIRKYLIENQIPVATPDKINLLTNLLIQDIISLLKFILLPKDDLNLACLLKSCFISYDEEQLFQLCQIKNQKNINLIDVLKQEQKEEYRFLQKILQKYSSYQGNVTKLLIKITSNDKILNNIKKEFGIHSLELINQFISLTINYENQSGNSLQEFIEQINKSNFNTKLENNGIFDEIQIMTIHGAKGLEAPIIFLPDTAHNIKSINGSNNQNIVWYKNKIPIARFNTKKQNQFLKEVLEEKSEESYNEYLRLLYVAMTRAENELYICGFSDQKLSENCWYNLIKNAASSKAKEEDFIDQELKISGKKLLFSDNFQQNLENIDQKSKYITKNNIILPSFLTREINKIEENDVTYPSKIHNNIKRDFTQNNKKSVNIGKITHKILEFLPNLTINAFESIDITKKYLNNLDIPTEKKDIIIKNIKNICHNSDFDFLFSRLGRSEVAISANIENQIISGQIDRLIIEEDLVRIIDYKTNVIKNIDLYRNQLELYSKIIQEIYPNKKIMTAIIWTHYGEIDIFY